MKAELNLASRPFGRSRLFWTASAAAGLILTITAGLLLVRFASAAGPEPVEIQAETQLSTRLAELNAEETRLRTELGEASTLVVYDRSDFLNQLLRRKGVSWTKIFADLEQVLPARVRMMQIRPEVSLDNLVELEMRVGAESWADFIDFTQALERSDRFGFPEVRGYAPPNDNEPYFRYELRVSYEQQL